MWALSVASTAARSVAASVRRSVQAAATRAVSTHAANRSSPSSLVTRVCHGDTGSRGCASLSPLRGALVRAKIAANHTALPALQPLSSLGGMSLAAYMALESNVMHLDMLRGWRPDVAKDLVRSISTVQTLRNELAAANDRIEDLEIMANDLTAFVERQKEEIAQLKRQAGW